MIKDRPKTSNPVEPYLKWVPDGDLIQLYSEQAELFNALIANLPEGKGEFRYAPGKWSIREVIGHLTDTERVCSYRLLCAARNDVTPLSSFDENEYVAKGDFHSRTNTDLLAEWRAVRTGTIALLNGLTSEMLHNQGTFKDRPVEALTIACIILGHAYHHIHILRERYMVDTP